MGRKAVIGSDRARRMLAQEAARIIVEQGIDDYRVAKIKAAERFGMSEYGSLPANFEIEQAVAEHLQLFRQDSHHSLLQTLRLAALSAMELLSPFAPRLVGPVLAGTAGEHSAVNLHVFSDSAEQVAFQLEAGGVPYKPFERRYRGRKGRTQVCAAYAFIHRNSDIEATVFPYDGIRQAPMSPVDGKPMRRADRRKVQAMVEACAGW
jgi:hypothetical protein